jgi:hypothetical protein
MHHHQVGFFCLKTNSACFLLYEETRYITTNKQKVVKPNGELFEGKGQR